MKKGHLAVIFCFILLLSTSLFSNLLWANGFIIIRPPYPHPMPPPEIPYINIKNHNVRVGIEDQIADTHIDQTFSNPHNYDIEGTYIFPIPAGAVISNFAIKVDNKIISATILERDEARELYEEIVREQKDPGLLEYVGQDLYKASIYPIPAKGETKVIIDYSQILERKNSVISYLYPLNTEKYSIKPLESVSIDINLVSKEEIKSIYSPTHKITTNRIKDNHATVKYKNEDIKPDKDFQLYYTLSDEDIGFNIVPYRNTGEDGFFLGMVAPAIETSKDIIVKKNIIFIIDTSGSMDSDDKIEQAKDSLVFCLNNLNSEDNFNVITFNSTIDSISNELMIANPDNIQKALNEVSRLRASGSTNIDGALETGLDQLDNEGTGMIIFLTDGLPTKGETDTNRILANVMNENNNTRIFVFGVGYDVNIHFLDKLSKENSGISDYVRPNEDIKEKVGDFYSTIQSPILTDIELDFGAFKDNIYDIFPVKLPDLFKGSQLIILGKYKTGGEATVRLSGMTVEEPKEYTYEVSFPELDKENNFIPLLFASRKIGYLLDIIRLEGEDDEIIEEIVALSKRYGIITEYTSFLAEEDEDMSYESMVASVKANVNWAFPVDTGSWAVSQSQNLNSMQYQSQVSTNTYLDASGNKKEITGINQIGDKTFYNKNNQYVDSEYKDQDTIKVQVYSEAYFQLASRFRIISKALSQGEEVIVILNNNAIQIGNEGKTKFTEAELNALGAEDQIDKGNFSGDVNNIEELDALGTEDCPKNGDVSGDVNNDVVVPDVVDVVEVEEDVKKDVEPMIIDTDIIKPHGLGSTGSAKTSLFDLWKNQWNTSNTPFTPVDNSQSIWNRSEYNSSSQFVFPFQESPSLPWAAAPSWPITNPLSTNIPWLK